MAVRLRRGSQLGFRVGLLKQLEGGGVYRRSVLASLLPVVVLGIWIPANAQVAGAATEASFKLGLASSLS